MADSYYVILGIDANATEDEIKSAYRREAKRCHPDCSGEDGASFRALRQAYEVLGDPQRRQAYDREQADEQRPSRQTSQPAGPEPRRSRRPPVEPLVPRQPVRDMFSTSPSGARWGYSAPHEIHHQVALTRRQAQRGGRLRIWVPAQLRCPVCRGSGGSAFFLCRHCLGTGSVVDEMPLDIAFPAGVTDGTQGILPIGRSGGADLLLVLHFRIDPQV